MEETTTLPTLLGQGRHVRVDAEFDHLGARAGFYEDPVYELFGRIIVARVGTGRCVGVDLGPSLTRDGRRRGGAGEDSEARWTDEDCEELPRHFGEASRAGERHRQLHIKIEKLSCFQLAPRERQN